VHPLAIEAMAQIGIDISEPAWHRAQGTEGLLKVRPFTACDGATQVCPHFQRARQAPWRFHYFRGSKKVVVA